MSMTIAYHEVNPQEVYTEAYGWLLDTLEDQVEDYYSYTECETLMDDTYPGGWRGFVKDQGGYTE